ncbi:MAG TPA: response regulator transcription factor, partial [Planctomycetota bacterium]
VLKTLREERCTAKVLVLTARTEVPDRVAGLRMGADDYLPKPFAFDELLARVDALGRRGGALSSDAMEIGPLTVDSASRTAHCQGARLELTAREYSVLACLARRQGSIVSREELEDRLYDEHNFPMSNAVPAAISRLRNKLSEAGARDLLRTHRGLGYVLEAPRA